MNAPSGTDPLPQAGKAPANWPEAIVRLAAARIDLIRIESGDFLRSGVKRVILLGIAVFSVISTWILALAGGVGSIAAVNGWPWYWVALAAAGVHLLAAILCIAFAIRRVPPLFPVTRSEFQKDLECIERQTKKKSNV